MKVENINNTPKIQFGYNLPAKKTYKAMQCYYELINDKSMAVEYKILHNLAKSRLHYIKFLKSKKEMGNFLEEQKFPSDRTFNEKLNYSKKLLQHAGQTAKEKLLSVYYMAI